MSNLRAIHAKLVREIFQRQQEKGKINAKQLNLQQIKPLAQFMHLYMGNQQECWL